jgi:hypothetical protein
METPKQTFNGNDIESTPFAVHAQPRRKGALRKANHKLGSTVCNGKYPSSSRACRDRRPNTRRVIRVRNDETSVEGELWKRIGSRRPSVESGRRILPIEASDSRRSTVIHRGRPQNFSSRLLQTTETLDAAIAAPAAIGCKLIPPKGRNSPMAKGRPTTL